MAEVQKTATPKSRYACMQGPVWGMAGRSARTEKPHNPGGYCGIEGIGRIRGRGSMKGQIYLTREQALKVQAWKQAVMYLTAITIQKADHLEIWKACDTVRELENDLFPGMNNLLYPDEKASVDKLEDRKGGKK